MNNDILIVDIMYNITSLVKEHVATVYSCYTSMI